MREIDENLIGYLAHSLDAETKREVEASLNDRPELRERFNQLRFALQPLEWDRDTIEPPSDLVERTVATLAHHLVCEHGKAPGEHATPVSDYLRANHGKGAIVPSTYFSLGASEGGSDVSGSSLSRRNVAAVAGLAILVLALLIPGILFVRDRANLVACQQRLATMYRSLMNYADTFDEKLPRVNDGETGFSFVAQLQRNGMLSESSVMLCPSRPSRAAQAGVNPLDYAYSFGYRDFDGQLVGLQRDRDDGQTPLLADAPPATLARCRGEVAPINHTNGQNVLFMNGSVRFCSHASLMHDDNLYCNQRQQIKAGVNRYDSMLGRGDEMP